MAGKISISPNEEIVMLEKIIMLDKDTAIKYFDRIKDNRPTQQILRKTCRQMSYNDISLECLQYVWMLSKNASLKIRFEAKIAYLVRATEDNHPRTDRFFTLAESNEIDTRDEIKLFKDAYRDQYKAFKAKSIVTSGYEPDNPSKAPFCDIEDTSTEDGWTIPNECIEDKLNQLNIPIRKGRQ